MIQAQQLYLYFQITAFIKENISTAIHGLPDSLSKCHTSDPPYVFGVCHLKIQISHFTFTFKTVCL